MLHLCKIVHIPNAYYQISKLADTSGQFKFTHFIQTPVYQCNKVFTARIRRMGKVLYLQVSVCPPPGVPQSQVLSQVTGPRFFPGVPHPWPGQDGVPPGQVRMGYPLLLGQNSRASTSYAAGGVPLAFTQDNLFVLF